MKKLLMLLLCSPILVGCVNYPKNYTYSPSVSVGGNSEVIDLPEPFARKPEVNKQPKKVTVINEAPAREVHEQTYIEYNNNNYYQDTDYYGFQAITPNGLAAVPVVNLHKESSLATFVVP